VFDKDVVAVLGSVLDGSVVVEAIADVTMGVPRRQSHRCSGLPSHSQPILL